MRCVKCGSLESSVITNDGPMCVECWDAHPPHIAFMAKLRELLEGAPTQDPSVKFQVPDLRKKRDV